MPKIDIPKKPYVEIRSHFIERLMERYNIHMSNEEYDIISKNKEITPIIKKNKDGWIGTINFKNSEIWIFYNKNELIPTTALEPLLSESDYILTIFGKKMGSIAHLIYKIIISDINLHINKTFESKKDAAIYYYRNSPFANFLIEKYVYGEWPKEKMIQTIKKILKNKHHHYKIDIVKKQKTHTQ